MIIKIIAVGLTSALMFSGCATNDGPEYDGRSYQQIKRYDIGTVTKDRPVVITDDGTGKFFGTVIGAVLGSTIGGGKGRVLMGLAGGIGGYYAGKEIGKANGDELTVELENGSSIIVVVKGKHIKVGDKIKIIKDGNKIAQVEKIN